MVVETMVGRKRRSGRRMREPERESRTLLVLLVLLVLIPGLEGEDCAWRAETALRGRTKPEMTKKIVTDARPLKKARIMGSWMKRVLGPLSGEVGGEL